ncbi:MAG: hypothetical protein BM556_09850 [Bacteriovorax sp. MedPE-SWde]|nr:MAG: hypothetical protein BM556_09850 [Bacteriovorax sp. MedPE-SWde]
MRNEIIDNIENEEGQAIFEFVVFLPVMLYLLVMIIQVGNSVNASINQQKATRGYAFYLLKGNSLGNRLMDFTAYEGSADALTEVSSFIVGWRLEQDSGGRNSYASYYQLPELPWVGGDPVDCRDPTDPGEGKSGCIKIFTMFGVCGETYTMHEDGFFKADYPGSQAGFQKNCNFR